MKVGKHSVVIGNVSPNLQVGEGSVVIGATDSHGNTILNQPMAVGLHAKAGPGSIAIGAFAGAGLGGINLPEALGPQIRQLVSLALEQQNAQLLTAFEKLSAELRVPEPKGSAILLAWEGVKALATIDGAQNLLARATASILSYIGEAGA
jgi:hypothetical protein